MYSKFVSHRKNRETSFDIVIFFSQKSCLMVEASAELNKKSKHCLKKIQKLTKPIKMLSQHLCHLNMSF